MDRSIVDGRSTPRYAAIFAFGVVAGSGVRLMAWALPEDVIERLADRLLPQS